MIIRNFEHHIGGKPHSYPRKEPFFLAVRPVLSTRKSRSFPGRARLIPVMMAQTTKKKPVSFLRNMIFFVPLPPQYLTNLTELWKERGDGLARKTR